MSLHWKLNQHYLFISLHLYLKSIFHIKIFLQTFCTITKKQYFIKLFIFPILLTHFVDKNWYYCYAGSDSKRLTNFCKLVDDLFLHRAYVSAGLDGTIARRYMRCDVIKAGCLEFFGSSRRCRKSLIQNKQDVPNIMAV